MGSKNLFPRLLSFFLFSSICIGLVIAGLWIIVIPENRIKESAENSLSSGPFNVELYGLKKGLFYNLNAETLILRNKNAEMIRLENILVKINPLYLFMFKLEASFTGNSMGGTVVGGFSISRNMQRADIVFNGMNIKDIVYLEKIGLRGTGLLDAKLTIDNRQAYIRFALDDGRLKNVTLAGINLPMELFRKAKGLIKIDGDAVEINSFSLEGDGIYGRIKGEIRNDSANLTLEIMPDVSVQGKIPLLMFMDKYRVSPGYYLIPIKTNLSSITPA